MDENAPTLADVDAAIAATLQPLRDQLRTVEARERLIVADLKQTREVKARLSSTLRKLDPTMPGPGRTAASKRNGHPPTDAETIETVKRAIEEIRADNPDGFVRTRIFDQLRRQGYAIGDNRLARAVEDLHHSGYLTLHKLGTGGSKIYKLTEDISNGSRPTD